MASRDQYSPAYYRQPRRITRPRTRGANGFIALLPAVLLIYAALTPAEVRFVIAGQNLYPIRFVGFAVMPFVLYRLMKNPIRWSIWDAVFFTGVFWMVLSFMFNYGPAEGLRRGSAQALDAFIPYIVGRCCIHNIEDLRKLLIYIAPGLIIAGLSLVMEVIAGRHIVRPTMMSIFGALPNYEGGEVIGLTQLRVEFRLGILRALGPFPHPILGGMFLATFLPLYLTFRMANWRRFGGAFGGLSAIFSVSSTGFLGLMVGLGILIIDYAQSIIRFVSWRVIIPTVLMLLFLMHMGTQNGLVPFLSQFTLNPQTALYRRRIWEYALQSVENNPWFGIGFENYERLSWMVVSSIDAHWLLLAVRYGVMTSLTFMATAVAAVALVGLAAGQARGAERQAHVGLAAAILCVIVPGFAVAFFGGVQAWFYMVIAIGISVGLASKKKRAPARQVRRVRPIPVYQGQRRPSTVEARNRAD